MKSNGFSDKLDGCLFHLGKILFFEVLIYPINQIRFIFRIFHKTPRVHFNPNNNFAFEIEIRPTGKSGTDEPWLKGLKTKIRAE